MTSLFTRVIKHPYFFGFGYSLLSAIAIVGILCSLSLKYFAPESSLAISPQISVLLSDIPLWTVIFLGGTPLVLQILFKLFKGDWGADSLAAIAIMTSVVLHEYLAGSLLVLMLAGGQALENYAMRKASSILGLLANRMPSIAHRKINEYIEDIPIDTIAINDQIVIYPHETCPVDGVVISGHGSMDESYLTGEPYQVSKAPGSTVISGAINGQAALIIRAEQLPKDSRYAKIMQVMQDAEQKRPSLRRLGDQIGAVFAPLALLFACATAYFTGDPIRFLAVLVVATPCPLLIAIPITIISAISLAAFEGIIIKDPTVLERLPTCKTAIFDKTGTLTYGRPTLEKIHPLNGFTSDLVLQLTASLERYSKHPLAIAILDAAKEKHLALLEALKTHEKPGEGLSGEVDGREIRVTSRRIAISLNPAFESLLPVLSHGLESIIIIDNQLAAILQFADSLRAEGKSFISHLGPSHQFNKIMIVSGDRPVEVNYLASVLGITETFADQTPEQKLTLVREEASKNPTLFMGDGINDAPALTAATVGLAFGHLNITGEAAGAVIMDNTLTKVDVLFHISEKMRTIALQSALGGMFLSIIAMLFAAFGFITPVVGALLQEGIDALAILNALRLAWKSKVDIDM